MSVAVSGSDSRGPVATAERRVTCHCPADDCDFSRLCHRRSSLTFTRPSSTFSRRTLVMCWLESASVGLPHHRPCPPRTRVMRCAAAVASCCPALPCVCASPALIYVSCRDGMPRCRAANRREWSDGVSRDTNDVTGVSVTSVSRYACRVCERSVSGRVSVDCIGAGVQ